MNRGLVCFCQEHIFKVEPADGKIDAISFLRGVYSKGAASQASEKFCQDKIIGSRKGMIYGTSYCVLVTSGSKEKRIFCIHCLYEILQPSHILHIFEQSKFLIMSREW